MNNIILDIYSKVNDLTIKDSYIYGNNFSLEYILDILKKLEKLFNTLRKEVHSANIGSETDEIMFFKEIKPKILSKLQYLREIYLMEISKPIINIEVQK